METMMFTKKIRLITIYTIITISLKSQIVQAQELFTLQPINKNILPTKLQVKLSKAEKSTLYKQVHYVQVGNLAKIQQNGTLTFSLPAGFKVTFNARKVEADSEKDYTWVGVSPDGLHQAIFLCKGGKLCGSIESKFGCYQLYTSEEGISTLMEVDLSKTKECKADKLAPSEKTEPVRGGRQDACQEAVRVLVLYTQDAANLSLNLSQIADLSIQQFNNAISNSAIGYRITNTLVKVGMEQISFDEGTDDNATADADRISKRTDVQNLRNQYNADLVITLTDEVYTTSFGSVINIPAQYTTAYAVVEAPQASLAGAYTFSHETGHLFGGFHDVSTASPNYAHGYAIPGQNARTLMAVRPNGDLSRILYFSTPEVTYGGTAIGTYTDNHVARRINEYSSTIVNFKPSVSSPFNANLDGPTNISNSGSYQFEVAWQCVQPISYEWRVSTDGFNFGSPIGYTESIYPYLSTANNGLYYLRCRIGLPGGQFNTISKYVSVNICNGCRAASESSGDVTSLALIASPNPVSGGSMNISFGLPENAPAVLTLTDVSGISVMKLDLGKLERGKHERQLDVSGFKSGVYIVNLQAGSHKKSQKVLLAK